MDIKGLRYFIAAAERLNFTTAAKECYITQTAMSLHISKMETELGFKLFERNKRVVELTEAGKDFLKYSRSLVDDYEAAIKHSTSVAVGVVGIIDIMLPSCLEGFVFMNRFSQFRRDYPDVELNLHVLSPDKMVDKLKKGRVDAGFGVPYEMELDNEIQVIKMREDPGVLCCSKEHRFYKENIVVTPALLEDETFVVTLSSATPATTRMVLKKWRDAGFGPNKFLEVANMDEMLMLIELNRGIGLFPKFVQDHLDFLTSGLTSLEVEYEEAAPQMITAIGYLKENTNPVLNNFLKYFVSE